MARTFKIACIIACVLFMVVSTIVGRSLVNAVGNLYVEVKILQQRVSILTSAISEKDRGTNGASKDEVK